jgi:hypothetical protein
LDLKLIEDLKNEKVMDVTIKLIWINNYLMGKISFSLDI